MANTIVKKLPKPQKFAGKMVTEVEVRETTVRDITEAEKEANPQTGLSAYYVALACQVLVRVGDNTGPFAPGQFASMGASNFYALRAAINEADELGEVSQEPQAAQT